MKLTIKVLLLLAVMVSMLATLPASAQVGVFPPYRSDTTVQKAQGSWQAALFHNGAKTGKAYHEGQYINLASGVGITLRVYPNPVVDNGLAINAMFAAMTPLSVKLDPKWDKKKQAWTTKAPEAILLNWEKPTVAGINGRGKPYLDLVLSKGWSSPEEITFYTIVGDGKRVDTCLDLLVFRVRHHTEHDSVNVSDVIELNVQEWPAGYDQPSTDYLMDLCNRVGNGTFKQLLDADADAKKATATASTTTPPTVTTTAPPANLSRQPLFPDMTSEDKPEQPKTIGCYTLTFCLNGKAYTGQMKVRLVDSTGVTSSATVNGPNVQVGGAKLPGVFKVQYCVNGLFREMVYPVNVSGQTVPIAIEGGSQCAGF